MDQERRRRWIQSQQQRLDDIRSRRLTPTHHLKIDNIRLSKTEKIIQMKQSTIIRQQQSMAIDECISKGDCKLIFLQQQKEDIGFKTFSEMMRTNSSWWGKADQLNPNESTLKNRLQFNQFQANQFTNQLTRKWTSTVNEVTELINKQQELQQLQKVKKIKLKPKPIPQVEEDEQHNDDTTKQFDPSSTSIKVFWFNIQINEWKPPVREGCTVTYVPSLNKAFMYGGIGNDLFKNVIALNTQTWVWRDIGVGKGEAPPEGRFGHTATLYKQSIIIYGGEKKFNNLMKRRECYSDVRMFNPAEKTWTQLKTNGDIIEGRRNHIAQCVGKYFIIFGGLNPYGLVLNDACALNLENNKWTVLHIENQFLEGVSDAASAALFNGEVKMENPYFSYECNKKKGKCPTVNQEGIYVFGGKTQNGEATNDLRVIQFGFKPIKIVKLKTKGQVPIARYSHSLNYFYHLNALILYGGRNDSKEENILNDLYVLQLMQMNWVLVQQIGGLKYGKFNHCSVLIDSKIMIFGGYTKNVYANADIQLIELDQYKVSKMIKENKNNNQLSINSSDLLTNTNLKVFKTEFYQEKADQEKNETNKQYDTMRSSQVSLKSFMPLPSKSSSQLMQDYKLLRLRSKFSSPNIFQSI
ncbi:unnamed protein product (macronuclear) [Paramecium tetraurelia]|uniref:Kelch motif family protein n=1 Tax=Paramecium tetraurelia TaxID=5888 RepID=A0D158_PARTE|nr:uncharacterized protein GSPATT00012299001 [Paramecium tetraurelia]CAK76775.1 unnamed protein product [Paramecium tetraurelia]|eukprot:XP_001444172.1 hypothetical protein (macronuclear) [Paramecium tetraurelia strain d4-2]